MIRALNRPGHALQCSSAAERGLLFLRNENAEVGVLAAVGGRTVVYRRPGCENVLDSPQDRWDLERTPPPAVSWQSEWFDYRGHTVWLGPQATWWEGVPERPLANSLNWPPDPWLEFGQFEVLDRSDRLIILLGPTSRLSGIRLKKEIQLHHDGSVIHHVEAENVSDRPVTCDLWTNTRVRPDAAVWTPIWDASRLRCEARVDDPEMEARHPSHIADGLLRVPSSDDLPDDARRRFAKFFVRQFGSRIGADWDGVRFVKKLNQEDFRPPTKGHAPVEIFVRRGPASDPLLELEFHGPSVRLSPGQTTDLSEIWTLRQTGEL